MAQDAMVRLAAALRRTAAAIHEACDIYLHDDGAAALLDAAYPAGLPSFDELAWMLLDLADKVEGRVPTG